MLVSEWLADSGDLLWNGKYNLNVPPDGMINMLDFADILSGWLACGFDVPEACWE